MTDGTVDVDVDNDVDDVDNDVVLTTVTMMMWSMSVTTLELGKGDNKISDVPPRVTQLCFAELCFIRVFTQCSVENIYLTLSDIWVNGQWSLKTRFN